VCCFCRPFPGCECPFRLSISRLVSVRDLDCLSGGEKELVEGIS
jgi:hypothetical protein